MMNKWSVGIFLFNEVEVLDFAGPFEVFSVTEVNEEKPFTVYTVSENGEMITARNGLKVQPDYSIENLPPVDILIIPGGLGAREYEIKNEIVIKWIGQQMKEVKLMTSVCTGALLLAKAGLLAGLKATTHWASIEKFKNEFQNVEVIENVKFVDEGHIITSAGISAGINMAFHIVKNLLGVHVAEDTAKRMEYDISLPN
ncbi:MULTISPECIES: DJ-1/PfpI family protein [Bacillus]|uniref:AraC family transcriptional regulator n=3 Tax=Bacillus thuringiensis TaxID=1428 RepID=A0AAP4V5S3_BACTU|nr:MULTISPECIES: DJ-1/PfpI family protein [Bacillus]AEA16523.1 AraC family transcriptional regulator [Bacillus thuringiensis serovar chinensis CT-43]AFV18658.1 AraC family transcriptional regulator [Bacillus thuringiensis Bt407]AGG01611.1 Transcriptional regulator, AraC family [Bacillus thuringiensis serovar thuringiensis str. IS5056]ALC52605.1 AraC family transcriptional regulator [Bacillus cereus]ARP58214.1 AraC family transcriptional regulator [Bacillus thuringiensis]